jgi:hypothetical protein
LIVSNIKNKGELNMAMNSEWKHISEILAQHNGDFCLPVWVVAEMDIINKFYKENSKSDLQDYTGIYGEEISDGKFNWRVMFDDSIPNELYAEAHDLADGLRKIIQQERRLNYGKIWNSKRL